MNSTGEPEPDPALRDTESVPLSESIEDFFEREVRPHVPDAWIDRSKRDTGLDVADYMVKLSYAPDNSRHRVELKLQYADQSSNQSYLGLTDTGFDADPLRR